MTRGELIEVVARAMCVYQDQDPDRVLKSMDKDRKPVIMWTHWKGGATAALAAIEAAGVRLVLPSEAKAQLIDGDERTTVRIFTPYAPPGG